MTRAAYEKIRECGELPSPTGVALQILEISQQEDSNISAIAAVVQADPAITSRLLKLVNSPLAGLSRQVGSVFRAVSFLGVKTVTHLALGFSLVSSYRKGPCAAFDYDLFWSESLAMAVAARHQAAHLKVFAPDEAFTCGLVSQIGRLALATVYPEAYDHLLRVTSADDREELAEIERAMFNIDNCTLAGEMMADWGMPELFRQAVRAQLDPDAADLAPESRAYTLAQVLELAGRIGLIIPRSSTSREALSALVVKASRLGISPDVYHQVFDSTSHEWRQVGAIFSVRTRRVPPLAEMYSQATRGKVTLEQRDVPRETTAALGDPYDVRG